MKVPFSWLKDYVEIDITAQELAEKLFSCGFEVEELSYLGAKINRKDVKVLPIFELLMERGGISEHDMFNTFNMGVGMSIVVSADDAETALAVLKENGEDAYIIGTIEESEEKITIC